MDDTTDRSLLDDLVEHNRTRWHVANSDATSAEAARGLCIIACHDPRLTRLLPQALGIERGDAVLIRIPGAGALPDSSDLLRSVAAAVYLNHCREVLVLGHTDCAIHRVTTSSLLDAMAARGVGRDAVPNDVRHFFGLRTDVRATVLETARAIREAPFIPRDTRVHAAIIDTHTGVLTVFERDDGTRASGSQHNTADAVPVAPALSKPGRR
jgi:carbonic anhydrase